MRGITIHLEEVGAANLSRRERGRSGYSWQFIEEEGSGTMALLDVSLSDKYTLDKGRVFLTGTQALVRLPLMQQRRDASEGYNTASTLR